MKFCFLHGTISAKKWCKAKFVPQLFLSFNHLQMIAFFCTLLQRFSLWKSS